MTLAEWEAVPCEPPPVMVTPYTPATVELKEHDAGLVPLAVRPTGVEGQVTVKPEGVTVEFRATVPAKF